MKTNPSKPVFRSIPFHSKQILMAGLALATSALTLHATAINVPNFSFESQPAPNTYPFVNVFVDSWEKAAEPAYYGPAIGTPFGIPWFGTAGLFLDVNPYANHDGTQAGYILGFPQVEFFQDYDSSPTHDFDATFDTGEIDIHYAYPLLIGVGPMGSTALALHVDDFESGVNVLQQQGFTLFTESDLRN